MKLRIPVLAAALIAAGAICASGAAADDNRMTLERNALKSQSVIAWWNGKGRWALQLDYEKCWQIGDPQAKRTCAFARKSLRDHTRRAGRLDRILNPYENGVGLSDATIAYWVGIGRCEQPGDGFGGVQWNHYGPTYQGGLGFYWGTWDWWAKELGVWERYPDAGLAPALVQIAVADHGRRVHRGYWGCIGR